MRNLIRGVVVMAILAAPVAMAAGTKGDKLPKKAKEGIQSTMKDFEKAWNSADPKKMAAEFAADGHYINPAGEKAVGRQKIEALFGEEFERGLRGSRAELSLAEARMVKDDLAFLDFKVKVDGTKSPQGEALPQQEFHAVVLMARRGSEWELLEVRPYKFMEMPPQGVGGAGDQGQQIPMGEPSPVPEPQPMPQPMPDRQPVPDRDPMPQRMQ